MNSIDSSLQTLECTIQDLKEKKVIDNSAKLAILQGLSSVNTAIFSLNINRKELEKSTDAMIKKLLTTLQSMKMIQIAIENCNQEVKSELASLVSGVNDIVKETKVSEDETMSMLHRAAQIQEVVTEPRSSNISSPNTGMMQIENPSYLAQLQGRKQEIIELNTRLMNLDKKLKSISVIPKARVEKHLHRLIGVLWSLDVEDFLMKSASSDTSIEALQKALDVLGSTHTDQTRAAHQ